jgi:hypothetical protein
MVVCQRSGGANECQHDERCRKHYYLVSHCRHLCARNAGRGIEFDFEYAIGSSQRRQARAFDTLTALATETTVDLPADSRTLGSSGPKAVSPS